MAAVAGSPNPGTPNPERVDVKAHIESFLKLLVGGLGLAYATGFVVMLTFLDQYGIREAGGEFFKLRYIYVGALCLAGPVMSVCILLGLLSGPHVIPAAAPVSKMRDLVGRLVAPAENMPVALLLMIVNVIGVFYCIIAFAHPGLFAAKQTLFDLLYIPLAVTVCLRLILGEGTLWSRRVNKVRWILVFVSFGISFFILKDIEFAVMFKERMYNYVILQLLFIFFVYRFTKWSILASEGKERAARLLVRLMIVCSLFVVGVFSFAHTVYNHIPAEKGGGDFSHVSDSQICFSDAQRMSIPVGLVSDMNRQPLCTVPVKVIEETATDLFVARSSDRGKRSERDVPNPAALWRSGEYRPVVLDISRSVISSVVILNQGAIEFSRPIAPSSIPQLLDQSNPAPQRVPPKEQRSRQPRR